MRRARERLANFSRHLLRSPRLGRRFAVPWPNVKNSHPLPGSKSDHNPSTLLGRLGGLGRFVQEGSALLPNQSIIASGSALRRLAVVGAACACAAAVISLGTGFASAGGQGEGTSFGLSNAVSVEVPRVEESEPLAESPMEFSESFVLETTAKRDITANVEELEERLEAERIAAEEAARAHEAACIEQAQRHQAEAAAAGCPDVYAVDFTIGRDAFVETWGARIDAYLAGFPLAGYGATFAEAAWEYGVDPRWSPAISNTESTRGTNCFMAYNAWGWMGNGWSSWTEAIHGHVKGLADGYGFTISVANAQKYCPPTYMDWYQKTSGEIAKI